ncbi:hypothetical protein L2U69_17585 [Zavarzinia compransoris]|uniref:hypothetical protein n=1 Tax=Zavarzinia marina TaxID=2911065 RepID=UPI001F35AAC5|nr:hypothetical protein [Zavarzinia marina]MCF4167464.1 hypothetical protein [Zavarzinia marina]
MTVSRRALLAGGFGLLAGACAGTAPRVAAPRRGDFGILLSDGTRVVAPPGAGAGTALPAVVFLPATDGTASGLYRYYAESHAAAGDFVAILPPGSSSRADYSSGERFAATVREWDERVRAGLDRHGARFGVDPARVALSGFSLGGDLAWALSLRSPEAYCGAVVMGSRCGFRAGHSLSILSFRGYRFALLRGSDESNARAGGMAAARRLLTSEGIAHIYDEVPGSHVRAPPPVFMGAVDYVLGRAPPAWALTV